MEAKKSSIPRRATIYDVAEAAGVAASTVSRALTKPGRVNPTTAEHVRAVAERLGYHLDPGRSAPAERSAVIAVVVADIMNPVFGDVIRGAEEAAREAGYTVVVIDGQESENHERVAVEAIVGSVVGVLVTSPRMPEASIRATARHRPTVVLNRVVRGLPSVLTDGARGARRASEHLGGLGHQRITYLAGPPASWMDGMRWQGVREAGMQLELKIRRVGPVAPTVPGGEQAARLWAQRPTTGVLAYNDLTAIGFMRGLRAMGLRVPADVSVVGFDNTDLAALVYPPLTSVASPMRALGATGVRNLLAIVGGAKPTAEPLFLPTKLVVRATTAQRRREAPI